MPRQLDDWLEGFMFYTAESECPDSYLRWSALHTISAAVQRQTYVEWVYHRFYPNIYCMLVGPPGIVHKTAAIRFSRLALKDTGVPTASEAISKEALIEQMKRRGGEHDALAVTASEFATFLRTSGPPMIEFLTDIYDCEDDWEYTTKGGGTVRIPKPYLTMFAGCTPGWLATEFDVSFIESGFARRVIWISESAPRFMKAIPEVTDEMKQVREMLVADLEIITQLEGEFAWPEESQEWFIHWYEEILPKQDIDYRLRGYLSSKPTLLLKVAQLVVISKGTTETSDDLILSPESMEEALNRLEALEPGMVKAFNAVGRNPYANDLERIADNIERNGGMPWSQIIDENVHALKRQELDEIMQNLVDMGLVKLGAKGGTRWYYPVGD